MYIPKIPKSCIPKCYIINNLFNLIQIKEISEMSKLTAVFSYDIRIVIFTGRRNFGVSNNSKFPFLPEYIYVYDIIINTKPERSFQTIETI